MKKIVITMIVVVLGTASASAATRIAGVATTTRNVVGKKETHTNETKEAQLKRLVSEGKITQAQADAITKMDKKKGFASSSAAHREHIASSTAKKVEKVATKQVKKTEKKATTTKRATLTHQ